MGRQFANDSMTPPPISVSRNEFKDEIPSDRPSHENTTPEHSNPQYTGRQYSDDWRGGFTPYGKSVTDMGQSPSKKVVDVDVRRADKGPES